MKSISTVLLALSIALFWSTAVCRGADYEPGTPSTYLFDTGSSAAEPLGPRQLADKVGWKVVPEDNVTHKFQGDAVFLNDRLLVVLRGKGAGAEVYGQTAAGAKLRAVLQPLGLSGKGAAGLSSVQILENSTAAVMVDVGFKTTDGGKCSLQYRLTVGQIVLEVRPGADAAKLSVLAPSRYVVVPDFFGDDMAFSAAAFPQSRLALPTENFLLNLVDGGNAMVMCVWQSNRQSAEAVIAGEGKQRSISGCEIQCAKDKNIWVAFLEGAGIWHERRISADETKAEVALDWKPPFPAKWRADWLDDDGAARSWFFRQSGQSDELAVTAAEGVCPCRIDGGRALVQLQPAGDAARQSPQQLLVYALDRSPATPITTFCPIDVLRNTLGVGPCQYILQTEGLGSGDTPPTPDSVMTSVETQFKKKREKKGAAEIRSLLKLMTEHMEHAQARIAAYAELADHVQEMCKAESQNAAPAAQPLGRIADRIRQTAAATARTPKPTDRAAQLAGEVAGLIGKEGALDECQRLGGELRVLGAIQDRALAKCRMDARWLRLQAAAMAAGDTPAAALAKKVQARTEKTLGVTAK